MKKYLFAFVTMLGFGLMQAQGAPSQSPAQIECASQSVLETLSRLIVSSNQMDPSLNFQFSQTREIPPGKSGASTKAGEVSCMAHLQVIRPKSGEEVDALDISYRIKLNNKTGLVDMEFSPMRKGQ